MPQSNGEAGLRVGETPVVEVPELSDYFGVRNLVVKDESRNAFGTHKDRKSDYVIRHALRRPVRPEVLCILTAGNAGLSLAAFAAAVRLPVTSIVGSIAPDLRRRLEQHCDQVCTVDLEDRRWSKRELTELAGAAQGRRVLDVTNIAAPYMAIADEIAPFNPDVLVLPVGGGELFLGIAARLHQLKMRTKLIGVTVSRPDTQADKLYAKWTPHRDRINRLTSLSSQHSLYTLDDESTLEDSARIVNRFVRCEPSSATAFDVLPKLKFGRDDKVMVLNTGTLVEDCAGGRSPRPG